MELRIISPQEGGFIKEIQWNNEELKKEISAKMEDYKGLVFTEDTIKEAKKDRADLNRLKTAFEDERKRIKKLCMEPYNRFESQVKEVTSLIDAPVRLIDAQIKEVEEKKRQEKQQEIERIFRETGFQDFVRLEQIFDPKWLNASVSIKKVEEQMRSLLYRIGDDVYTIHQLPEFSFEAMEVYKKTLDVGQAVQEGKRLSDIQKSKAEYEEQQRQKAEREKMLQEERETREQEQQNAANVSEAAPEKPAAEIPKKTFTIDFRVIATEEQLMQIKTFFKENGIQYGPVPKKGE